MESIEKGKKIINIIIVVFILISAIAIIVNAYIYTSNNDAAGAVGQLVRGTVKLFFECLICYFLYKGIKWAKTLLTILCLAEGIFGILGVIAVQSMPIFEIQAIIISIIYIVLAIVLITYKPIESFLASKRNNIVNDQTDLEKNK